MQKNPSGHISFPTEYDAYPFLEKMLLPKICTSFIAQSEFEPGCIIDYKGERDGKTILVEVKNWFITVKDLMQLIKYLDHAPDSVQN